MPRGFPFGLSDTELASALEEMMDPATFPGFDDFSMLRADLKLALLSAGLHERSFRATNASTRQSLRIAYAALVVVAVTLVASVVIAFVH